MDNDCETETDVLETAKKTVLEDLEVALQLQREEDLKSRVNSDGESCISESDLTSYHSEDEDSAQLDSISGSEESSTVQSDISPKYVKAKKNLKFLKNFSQ